MPERPSDNSDITHFNMHLVVRGWFTVEYKWLSKEDGFCASGLLECHELSLKAHQIIILSVRLKKTHEVKHKACRYE